MGDQKSHYGPRKLCRHSILGDTQNTMPRSKGLKTLKGLTGWILCRAIASKRYIMLKTIFGKQDQAKEIKVIYLDIDAPSSHDMIIG